MAVEVLSDGHLLIVGDGERYTIPPGGDLTGQPQEIVDIAEEAWTPEVVAAYRQSLPPVASAAPITVSARQIRLWLISNGILLTQVQAAINAIEDPAVRDATAVEWEYAPYVERSHPMLVPLADALGLTAADVDRAFVEASQL
jgi:hypothetical protein